ncbi:hypothetical protein LSAT2_009017 [Lamellibrachia satsuma]|nr:hypothetical protein LSAT2_009017 [Lamellibrachia satsuma]
MRNKSKAKSKAYDCHCHWQRQGSASGRCCEKRIQPYRQCCQAVRNGCGDAAKAVAEADCKGYVKSMFTLDALKRKLPILKWLPKYGLKELQGDAIAGTTVALTVIPQGLALAQLAELPPQYGLYSAFMGCIIYCFSTACTLSSWAAPSTVSVRPVLCLHGLHHLLFQYGLYSAFMGCIIYCVFGTAKDITLGPTAIMSLMTAEFGVFHNEALYGDVTLAVILTLFTGIIQFLMGILYVGFVVDYISYPVISSFTTAAAITIAFSQCKKWLGLANIPREIMHQIYALFSRLPEANKWDAILGICVMIILYFMKKLKVIKYENNNVSIPLKIIRKLLWFVGTARNAVVMIATGVLAYYFSIYSIGNLSLTGEVKSGLPAIIIPAFTLDKNNITYTTGELFSKIGSGFAIVPLLSLIETIAIGQAFARKNKYRIDANQELIGIGVANIVGSFVQAYPVTGSFSRTAVNSASGVRTPAGGLFTAALVLLALGLLTPLFQYIPTAALSCVIIIAVLDMVNFQMVANLWRVKKIDLIPWVVTFICSFVLGIEFGIMVGVGLTLLMLLYPWARPGFKVIKEETAPMLSTSNTIMDRSKDVIVIEVDQGLRFPGNDHLKQTIQDEALDGKVTRSVVLDCSHIADLDFASAQAIKQLIEEFKALDASLVVSCMKPGPYKVLEKAKVKDLKNYESNDEAIRGIIESSDDVAVRYDDDDTEPADAGDIKMKTMDNVAADGDITAESGDDAQNNGQAKSASDVPPV